MLRPAILILGLGTAGIHLGLDFLGPQFTLMFTLNSLGYLALLVALFANVSWLVRRRRTVVLIFMGYTAVTILGWVAIGARDIVAYTDKAIEMLLILALWRHLRTIRRERIGLAGPATA